MKVISENIKVDIYEDEDTIQIFIDQNKGMEVRRYWIELRTAEAKTLIELLNSAVSTLEKLKAYKGTHEIINPND